MRRMGSSAKGGRGAQPDEDQQALGCDGERNDGQGRVPQADGDSIQVRVQGRVAGGHVAVGQQVGEDGFGLGQVVRGDIAPRGNAQDEKDEGEQAQAGDGKGGKQVAVEAGGGSGEKLAYARQAEGDGRGDEGQGGAAGEGLSGRHAGC